MGPRVWVVATMGAGMSHLNTGSAVHVNEVWHEHDGGMRRYRAVHDLAVP